jgi:hypothetical protein
MNRWSVLIAGLAIVTASCGGDSSSGDTSDPPAETAAPDTAAPDTEPPSSAAPPTEPSPTEPTTDDPDETDETAPATDAAVEATEADRPDPCSVWTVADLEAATGLAFAEGVYNETLSVNGQDICDWLTAGDTFANAQVLVLAPGLDHDFLREGTNTAFGPVTDLDIAGANAAHISVDGVILGLDVGGGIVLQLAYIPPGGPSGTGDQLIQLADAAVANLADG